MAAALPLTDPLADYDYAPGEQPEPPEQNGAHVSGGTIPPPQAGPGDLEALRGVVDLAIDVLGMGLPKGAVGAWKAVSLEDTVQTLRYWGAERYAALVPGKTRPQVGLGLALRKLLRERRQLRGRYLGTQDATGRFTTPADSGDGREG